MWKKDLPIFLRPCRTSQPSWRTAAGAGPGPAEAPLGSSPLRDIPAAAGGLGSSTFLAASRLDADELSISDDSGERRCAEEERFPGRGGAGEEGRRPKSFETDVLIIITMKVPTRSLINPFSFLYILVSLPVFFLV
jgi:hypothetical protein